MSRRTGSDIGLRKRLRRRAGIVVYSTVRYAAVSGAARWRSRPCRHPFDCGMRDMLTCHPIAIVTLSHMTLVGGDAFTESPSGRIACEPLIVHVR